MARKLLFLTNLIFFVSFIAAQDSQAENLFNNAATFMAAGKHQDALKDYQTIVDKYADSGWADKALLEIGHYYQNQENDSEKALVYYTRIKEEFPQSESAPAAYFFSSQIRELLASNRVELDSAGNDLLRMTGLYPDSEWEADALFLMGKINFRLGNYALAQSYLQQLLLYYPHSELVPWSFILRSKIAYSTGKKGLALEILARMQTFYPKNKEAYDEARMLGRLIQRMNAGVPVYNLDRSFPASTPKSFKNPQFVQVNPFGIIAITDANGVHIMKSQEKENNVPLPHINLNARDLVDLTLSPNGLMVFCLDNQVQVLNQDGSVFSAPFPIDELESLAIDDFGRYYALDGKQRDAMIYDRKGTFLRKLGIDRMKKVRCRDQEVWVLGSDGNTLIRFSADLKNLGNAASFDRVKDFCFDTLGNLYVLYNKGSNLAILSREGTPKASLDFKNGSYPLRSANAVATDISGAIYVVDSKGGAVHRFY